jgi:hypothetical protein
MKARVPSLEKKSDLEVVHMTPMPAKPCEWGSRSDCRRFREQTTVDSA